MKNNQLINWLAENLSRLFQKSPKFFLVWTWISGGLTALTGLPQVLQFLGVTLPPPFDVMANKALACASAAAFFMSMLTSQNNVQSVNDKGELLAVTNDKKLPFTAIAEKNEAKKEDGILNPETPKEEEEVLSKDTPVVDNTIHGAGED